MRNSADIVPNELRDWLAEEQQKCILMIDNTFSRQNQLQDLDMEEASSIVDLDKITTRDTEEAAMDVGWYSTSS